MKSMKELPKAQRGQKLPKNKDGLTARQLFFIDKYLELGNATKAAIAAGYSDKSADVKGSQLLSKSCVKEEIERRQQKFHEKNIATSTEVMEYFTKVMNGEILDQFGLEAPLAERTKAAVELAKRTVDIDNRVSGKPDGVLEIKLDWKR